MTNMTPNDWRNVARILLGNSAKTVMESIEAQDRIGTGPVRNAYMALGHTDLTVDLDNLAGFRRAEEYPDQSKIIPSEFGAFSYFRFFVAANPIGAINTNVSARDADVYPVICAGQEAASMTSLEGYNAKLVYRDPLMASSLALYAEIGYKFADAPRVLYDQWVIRALMTLQYPV